MKRIHITESQLESLRQRLSEAMTVDATKETEAKGGNIGAAWQDMKSKNPSLDQQASDGEVTLSVNPKGVDEEVEMAEDRKFTKRQIKEAKLKKLRKSCERFTKRDLK